MLIALAFLLSGPKHRKMRQKETRHIMFLVEKDNLGVQVGKSEKKNGPQIASH